MGSIGYPADARYADRLRKNYFPVVSALLLALTLLSFSDNLLTNVGQRSNHDIKFIVHGLFCLAWMLVFATQANLVRSGNVRLHRKLGMAAIVVAAGVTLSTLYVFVAVWKGWDALPAYAKVNRAFLLCFAVLVLLGFLNRRRADWHKRLLYIATLFMMEPVLSRAFDPFNPILDLFSEQQVDDAWWVFFVVVWNSFFLTLFAYDWVVEARIHPVTAGGYLLFCGIWTAVWFV